MLRAVAAGAVVLCHFSYISIVLSGRPNDPIPLYKLASGVDLFFVISGFIMVLASERLFAAPDGRVRFIRRRLLRIVPLYWVATAALLTFSTPAIGDLVLSLLFIPHTNAAGTVYPVLASGWTLNYEMFFYGVFALFIGFRRNVAVPAICFVLCLLVCIGQIARLPQPLSYWCDPIILEFCFGMIIAVMFSKVSLPTTARAALVIGGIVAILLLPPPGGMPSTSRVLVWGIPSALIFAGTVLGKEIRLGAATNTVLLLGDSSYSLYLLHPLVADFIIIFWQTIGPYGLRSVITVGVLACVAISIATFSFLERPTLALAR